jgi:hypothetical protein
MLHACCIQLHNSSFDLLCMLKLGCSLTMTIISTLRGTTARAPEVGILRGWATLRMLLWAVLCLRSRQIKLRCRGLNLNSDPQEGKIFPAVILGLPCFICGVASNIFVSFVVLPRISLFHLWCCLEYLCTGSVSLHTQCAGTCAIMPHGTVRIPAIMIPLLFMSECSRPRLLRLIYRVYLISDLA